MAIESLTLHSYKAQMLDVITGLDSKAKAFENHPEIHTHLALAINSLRSAADNTDAAARRLEDMGV